MVIIQYQIVSYKKNKRGNVVLEGNDRLSWKKRSSAQNESCRKEGWEFYNAEDASNEMVEAFKMGGRVYSTSSSVLRLVQDKLVGSGYSIDV